MQAEIYVGHDINSGYPGFSAVSPYELITRSNTVWCIKSVFHVTS